MKYYSKSPQDLERERQLKNENQQKSLSKGRRILILDIFLLILIGLLFVYIVRPEMLGSSGSENIKWKNWSMQTDCSAGICELKIILEKDFTEKDRPKSAKWFIKTPDNTVAYEENRDLIQTGDNIFRSDFSVPKQWPEGKIFILLSSGENETITIEAGP